MKRTLDIRNFNDYRAFLRLHFDTEKESKSYFSYQYWAQKMELKDKSSISKVVQGHRNAGEMMIEKLVKYFEFGPAEASYFRDLVKLQKIKNDSSLTVALMQKMDKMQRGDTPRFIDNKVFRTIGSWYSVVIKEMINIPGFKSDPEWISRKLNFKVKPSLIKKTISEMISIGVLDQKKDGSLMAKERRLSFGDQGMSEAIKNYHESNLGNTVKSIRDLPMETRDVSTSTFCMRHDDVPKAIEMIRGFRADFCKSFEVLDGDGVFQIQIQFIPQTKKIERSDT